jgi:microcystin-dependent protein
MNWKTPLIIVFTLVLLGGAGDGRAAPVTPVPGEGAGFLYFPTPIAPAAPAQTETIGRISLFPSATIPTGWLECDGSTVSAAAYPRLVEYLAGASAMSATLPDLRGEFVRGLDSGRGVDVGRVVGTSQPSENLAHSHLGNTSTDGDHSHPGSMSSTDGDHNHGTYHGFAGSGAGSGTLSSPLRTSGKWGTRTGAGTTMSWAPDHVHTLSIAPAPDHTHSVTLGDSGGVEARPRNSALIFAIRAE